MSRLAAVVKSRMVKHALYASGALDLWHRVRNRDRLTVITFHRILPRSDPRWSTSDPEYTLPLDLFEASLEFFQRHYHVVSLDEVFAGRLPERALLITFDDGWSDNAEFALPALRAAGLPSVMFVAGDAVDRAQPFWQEQLIAAWRSGRLDAATARRVWADLMPPANAPRFDVPRDDLAAVRALITAIERIAVARRTQLVSELSPILDDGERHMINGDQLRSLAAARVAIGAHGQTHSPLTDVLDVDAELAGARTTLERLGGRSVTTLSFPHGRFDDRTLARARAAGYRLCFTSKPELPSSVGAEVLGRVGFTADTITHRDGRFAPELLALHLFRKPHADSG